MLTCSSKEILFTKTFCFIGSVPASGRNRYGPIRSKFLFLEACCVCESEENQKMNKKLKILFLFFTLSVYTSAYHITKGKMIHF